MCLGSILTLQNVNLFVFSQGFGSCVTQLYSFSSKTLRNSNYIDVTKEGRQFKRHKALLSQVSVPKKAICKTDLLQCSVWRKTCVTAQKYCFPGHDAKKKKKGHRKRPSFHIKHDCSCLFLLRCGLFCQHWERTPFQIHWRSCEITWLGFRASHGGLCPIPAEAQNVNVERGSLALVERAEK